MSKVFRISVLFSLGLMVAASTGCARKKNANRLNALESQVNTISDELVRLDQQVQEVRGGAGSASAPSASAVATSGAEGGSVYRTPSGFELPSINIQKALKNAGYYQGTVDGKIGSATKDAVKAFQRDNGLEADGVVGRRTWDKLKVHVGGAIK